MKNRKSFARALTVWLSIVMLRTGVAMGAEAFPPRLAIANEADQPVYATAIRLPAKELARAVGTNAEGPLQLVDAGGQAVPVLPGTGLDQGSMYAFLSLSPHERVDLNIRAAAQWNRAEEVCSASFDLDAGTAVIDNGVLRLDYRSGRWDLSFSGVGRGAVINAVARQILTGAHLEAWLDTEQRGRLMEVDPRPLGLVSMDDGVLSGGEAKVHVDGSVTLTLIRTFGGDYANVELKETYTLPAGWPLLIYDPVFTNSGTAPRYLAYVDLGGGLRARYGKLMQAEPVLKYEEPRHTRPILLSGNANAYTRVPWRPEPCWIGVSSGDGCGIGISTVEPIRRALIGSTVWDFASQHSFLACLLQPEDHGELKGLNFPMVIEPGKQLERLGLALVATSGGLDIRRQTGNTYRAMIEGKLPAIQSSCAVYLDGRPLQPAEVHSFNRPETLVAADGVRQAALAIDFRQPYLLTAGCDEASAEHSVILSVRDLAKADGAAEVMRLESPEEQTIDFTALTGWLGKRMEFVLRVEGAGRTPLYKLELAPAPMAAPELSSPSDGLSLTDLALFFRWKRVEGALDYELQFARDPGFAYPETRLVRSEIDWPIYMLPQDQLLEPGTWFWRVRGLDPDGTEGRWSSMRTLTVNDDHDKQPMKFQVSPEQPLFTFEGYCVKDWSKFKDTIPKDLRPYAAFNAGEKFNLIEHLRPLAENGQRVFLRTQHPGPITKWTPLSDVEEVFQTYTNVMGIMGGETLSASYHGDEEDCYANRLLKLCGKYGRFFYEADGTYPGEDKWEELYARRGPLMREYREYLIFAQKNNILHRQFLSQSSVLGLYLSGNIAAQGAWEDGGWYWQQVGFRKLGGIFGQRGGEVGDMPRIFYSLNFLMGVSRGCDVFSLEGQTGVVRVGDGYRISEQGLPANASPSAYYTTEGELTPSFVRFTEPFIRGVINHRLIPTREQVLDQTRLAVYNDGVSKASEGGDPYYYQWEALYRGTYGFRDIGVYPGTLMEYFPNTGRYHFIPVFPEGAAELKGVKTLPLSRLQDAGTVRSVFDQAYPAWYAGDALVQLVGDTLTVLNSNENTDETQRYHVPLDGRGAFVSIGGDVEPHSYVMGKFEKGNRRLWLQSNTEYEERDTRLALQCARRPVVTVAPADAAKLNQWDEETATLTLTLSHASGAVEVTIE